MSLHITDINQPIEYYKSAYDISAVIFSVIWVGFLVFILYHFFLSCFRRNTGARGVPRPPPRPRSGPSSGWFPGGMGDDRDYQPPPPYSKDATPNEGWRPGFWTGAAIGGALNHLYNRARAPAPEPAPAPRRSIWDWERPRVFEPRSSFLRGPPATSSSYDDRGEGSSNLGSMRRSTGLGGSNVR